MISSLSINNPSVDHMKGCTTLIPNSFLPMDLTPESLDCALQPIVNIQSGICFGYEASLTGWRQAGFPFPDAMQTAAHQAGKLTSLMEHLFQKALKKFVEFPDWEQIKLFLPLDTRLFQEPNGAESIRILLLSSGFPPGILCLGIQEKNFGAQDRDYHLFFNGSAGDSIKISLNGFGTGCSELKMLYNNQVDFIKIPEYFIKDIQSTDSRKKHFISTMIHLSHLLGISVIAEHVDTPEAYHACLEIGCDYIQGSLIQGPTTSLQPLGDTRRVIAALQKGNRRHDSRDRKIIQQNITQVDYITLSDDLCGPHGMVRILESFRNHKATTFFPVVSKNQEPLGMIREQDLKEYVYSMYGKDLLLNRSLGKQISSFITYCPMADVNTTVDKLLEMLIMVENLEGILLTENGKYCGFLRTQALLKILSEKNIQTAMDLNPLTQLPGNLGIAGFINETFSQESGDTILTYFDFDSFKPFNDIYGFRQGDRVIILFADIIKRLYPIARDNVFLGHLGGDDFFAGMRLAGHTREESWQITARVISCFGNDAASLYSSEDRKKGYIDAAGRDGQRQRFQLVSVSAALLLVEGGRKKYDIEILSNHLAHLKKQAKMGGGGRIAAGIIHRNGTFSAWKEATHG